MSRSLLSLRIHRRLLFLLPRLYACLSVAEVKRQASVIASSLVHGEWSRGWRCQVAAANDTIARHVDEFIRVHHGRRSADGVELLALLIPHFQQAVTNALLFETNQARRMPPASRSLLTRRETEVSSWIAQGKTNREIGIILGISTRTVEKHLENVLRKLQIENRTTAALQLLGQVNEPVGT